MFHDSFLWEKNIQRLCVIHGNLHSNQIWLAILRAICCSVLFCSNPKMPNLRNILSESNLSALFLLIFLDRIFHLRLGSPLVLVQLPITAGLPREVLQKKTRRLMATDLEGFFWYVSRKSGNKDQLQFSCTEWVFVFKRFMLQSLEGKFSLPSTSK